MFITFLDPVTPRDVRLCSTRSSRPVSHVFRPDFSFSLFSYTFYRYCKGRLSSNISVMNDRLELLLWLSSKASLRI